MLDNMHRFSRHIVSALFSQHSVYARCQGYCLPVILNCANSQQQDGFLNGRRVWKTAVELLLISTSESEKRIRPSLFLGLAEK